MHILVVDDSPSVRSVLCEAMRLEGHLTAMCESAEVAVQMVPYVDAVICDGLEFAGFKVVAMANRLGTPIVLYTGSEEIANAAAAGRIPCIRKPSGVEELLAALMPHAVAA